MPARTPPTEALNADSAEQGARKALAGTHKAAQALTARLGELRHNLATLGDRPADVASAGAWAQQRTALQAEIGAVEGLAEDARAAIAPAEAALQNAEQAVQRRLQEQAAEAVEAARVEWAEAQARLHAEHGARVALAERACVALSTAAQH